MTAALSPQIAPALVPTVVLGGESSLVVDKIAPHLREHGLAVIAHCDWYKARSLVMPEVTRVLFMLTDMVGHHLSVPMVDEARSRGIKVIYGCRKYAVYASRLAAAGFPALLPASLPAAPTITVTLATLNPLPQEEAPMPPIDVASLTPDKQITERVVALLANEPSLSGRMVGDWLGMPRYKAEPATKKARAILGIVPGSEDVLVQRDTYLAACASRGIPPITLPPDNIVMRPKGSLPGRHRTRETLLTKVIAHLSQNPLATAKEVEDALGNKTTSVAQAATAARIALGISIGRGRSAEVTVNVEKWKKTCEEHGLTEVYSLPIDGVIARPIVTRPLSEHPVPTPATKPIRAPRPLREHHVARPPVPVAASVPASSGDPLKDVRDLVELLRSEMVKHRIESLTLTATETKVRRLVVVDESL